MKQTNTINAILNALAASKQPRELVFALEPNLIQDAINALTDYRKVFAPVIPDLTDTQPIYAAYERMRQANEPRRCILLLVECRTLQEFRDAIDTLPRRKSSEWRYLDEANS